MKLNLHATAQAAHASVPGLEKPEMTHATAQVAHVSAQAAHAGISNNLVRIFTLAAMVSVANIYYLQPLLSQMAASYGVGESQAGVVATLTQVGYALGLLLLVPLSEVREKRRLVLTVIALDCVALTGMFFSPALPVTAVAALFVGLLSVIPQLLIPLAAQLARPDGRGRVIGTIMSGLLTGILLSRVVGGFIGEHLGWRTMYGIAILLMAGLWLLLSRTLPVSEPVTDVGYVKALRSLPGLIRRYAALRENSVIGAMSFLAFNAFWATLSFLLAGAPFRLGADAAGAFGLAGLAGASLAPLFGRLADARGPHFAVGLNLGVIALALVVFGAAGAWSIPALVIGTVLFDAGVQGCNVGCQARIHSLSDEYRSRLTSVFMTSYFVGGALGTQLGTFAFEQMGWTGIVVVGAVSTLLGLAAWLAGRSNVKRV